MTAEPFKNIFCITDSKRYQKIAKLYGTDKMELRPKKISLSNSPDIGSFTNL